MSRQAKRRPATLLIGTALIIIALLLIASTVSDLIQGKPHEKQFIAPGSSQSHIADAGRYYLWHHYKTVYEGEQITRPKNAPSSLEITIQDATGAELTFHRNDKKSWSIGNHGKKSIGYIEATRSQKVQIDTVGDSSQKVILSFSESDMRNDLWIAFRGLAVAAVTGILGLPLFIWGFISFTRGSR
ncbi:MAG: hypothetical protein HOI66_11375 [Verrucomicrobia bacterium]|nr:hypothetical protein [Verrucomicrobiota bacterium]